MVVVTVMAESVTMVTIIMASHANAMSGAVCERVEYGNGDDYGARGANGGSSDAC